MSALSRHGVERTREYGGRCDGCGKSLVGKAAYVRTAVDGRQVHDCYKCFQKWTQRKDADGPEAPRCMHGVYTPAANPRLAAN